MNFLNIALYEGMGLAMPARTTKSHQPAQAGQENTMTTRLITVAFFNSAKDNNPKTKLIDWQEFCEQMLTAPVIVPRGKSHEEAKKSIPAFSLASYVPGTTRAKENVQFLDGLVLDVDQPKDAPDFDPITMVELQGIIHGHGIEAHFYETFSSAPGWPKFRVVIPTAAPVLASDWHRFVDAALVYLGLDSERIKSALDLKATKDCARLWFLPAVWEVEK